MRCDPFNLLKSSTILRKGQTAIYDKVSVQKTSRRTPYAAPFSCNGGVRAIHGSPQKLQDVATQSNGEPNRSRIDPAFPGQHLEDGIVDGGSQVGNPEVWEKEVSSSIPNRTYSSMSWILLQRNGMQRRIFLGSSPSHHRFRFHSLQKTKPASTSEISTCQYDLLRRIQSSLKVRSQSNSRMPSRNLHMLP